MRPPEPAGNGRAAPCGRLAALAAAFAVFARAFDCPRDRRMLEAMRHELPADLADLAEVLGTSLEPHLGHLRRRLQAVADSAELLRLYSRLFLQPPARVPLNTGFYLDGVLGGPAEQELERWYRHYGLRRARSFRDLCDHLVPQLEFAAFLLDGAAGGGDHEGWLREAMVFFARHPRRWIGPLLGALERAEADIGATPYGPLARMLDRLIACAPGGSASIVPPPPVSSPTPA